MTSISISDATIIEGDRDVKLLAFVITRTGEDLAFDYTVSMADGTAKASDGDYNAFNATFHFDAGSNTRTVYVAINGDTRYEGDETSSRRRPSAPCPAQNPTASIRSIPSRERRRAGRWRPTSARAPSSRWIRSTIRRR